MANQTMELSMEPKIRGFHLWWRTINKICGTWDKVGRSGNKNVLPSILHCTPFAEKTSLPSQCKRTLLLDSETVQSFYSWSSMYQTVLILFFGWKYTAIKFINLTAKRQWLAYRAEQVWSLDLQADKLQSRVYSFFTIFLLYFSCPFVSFFHCIEMTTCKYLQMNATKHSWTTNW